MAQKNLNARISWRRDTSANWTSANPVLLNGEIIVVDTAEGEVRFKIGNGSKTYTQLPFEDEAVRNLIDTKSAVTLETWNNADNADSSITIGNLTINKIKSKEIYDAMKAAGKVDENELYLIEDDNFLPIEITTSLATGVEIGTITVNGDTYTLYAPESITAQADLFENDPTSDAYVKNRIFGYYDETKINVFPLTTLFKDDAEYNWYGDYYLGFDYSDISNKTTYIVTFDGIEYACQVYGSSPFYLGGLDEYPFRLQCSVTEPDYSIHVADESIDHTLQIDRLEQGPVKLTSDWIESATPDKHASTHATGGSDPITPTSIGAATTATATTTSNGLMSSDDKVKLDAIVPENIITTTTIFDSIVMKDQINGLNYIVCMQNGNLVSYIKTGITLVTLPDKMTYMEGEYLDTTGMIISIVDEDGSVKEVTNYTCDNYVTIDNPVFIITCVENNVEYTLTINVTVTEFDETILQDFYYQKQNDGTYLITGWKYTVNGVASSTEMIVPDNAFIII